MNIVQFCLLITVIFFVISSVVDITNMQAVIRGKRINIYNNSGQKVRNIKPDGGTYIGLSLLFDFFLFVASVGAVLAYKYTTNWWALFGAFLIGYAGCGMINKRIYSLPDLESQKEEKKMSIFKMPTGKELDQMLDQLSDEDKKKIAEKFEKDVQKEDQHKEKQTEKEVQEAVHHYVNLNLSPIFSPVYLKSKLGCDTLTMYHVINKLADQGKISMFLQLACPKCGKLINYDKLEDIPDPAVCPHCGEKIEDPTLKINLLCKRIDNEIKIVDVVDQLQSGTTIFPVDLAYRLNESIEMTYKVLEDLYKQHKVSSFLEYHCQHCGHLIDYSSIADIPPTTHCSECGIDVNSHEVMHKAVLLYRKLKQYNKST